MDVHISFFVRVCMGDKRERHSEWERVKERETKWNRERDRVKERHWKRETE